MKINSINYQPKHENSSSKRSHSNAIQFTGIPKFTNTTKKTCISESLGSKFKKLIGLDNIIKKGSYKIRIPFFTPNSLTADEIRIEKFANVTKKSNYTANTVLKSYGKLSGQATAPEIWLYPGSKTTKTAQIKAKEIAILGEIEEGANIIANEAWIFPKAKVPTGLNIKIIHRL